MSGREHMEIIDITDERSFRRLPPCADPRFDHRSCDYWEDEVHGSKASRPAWWQGPPDARRAAPATPVVENPFAPAPRAEDAFNPFAPSALAGTLDPLAGDDPLGTPDFNPFAPAPVAQPKHGSDVPRKLRLLDRGRLVFGTYAKVLLLAGEPAVYAQFGPLSAFPRAQQIRSLYPRLPQSPLPAVITCIATTAAARGRGHAQRLIGAVRDDLASRGFSAIEAYPDLTLARDDASAASPRFWERCCFSLAIDDARYPVMRLGLH